MIPFILRSTCVDIACGMCSNAVNPVVAGARVRRPKAVLPAVVTFFAGDGIDDLKIITIVERIYRGIRLFASGRKVRLLVVFAQGFLHVRSWEAILLVFPIRGPFVAAAAVDVIVPIAVVLSQPVLEAG